jgi:hypothetical protein
VTLEFGSNLTSVLLALITAAGAFTAAFFAYQASTKTILTHNLVNSRMTELLALSNAAARAQGVAAGVSGDLIVPPVITTSQPINTLTPPTG